MTEATLTVRWSDFGLGWFEGTAAGCGTGGMVLRFGVRPDGASGWEIVQGLGTGDLKAVTGHGVETSSGFQGTVDCDQPLGPVSLSTTLLEPTPSTGTLTGTPAHQQLGFTTYEVTPMAGQTNTPRLFVVESPMDIGYLFQVYAWWRDAAGEMRRDDCTPGLCNTGMFWWFLPPVCEGGGEAAVRAIIDDVELPPFSLGWDVPATLNGGAHGGGRGDGRVVCP